MNKIQVDITIADALTSYSDVFTHFSEIENSLSVITSKLSQSDWSGVAHDKCTDINDILKIYLNKIYPLYEVMNKGISTLEADSNDFHNASNSVKTLNAW